ncbi:MAG: hypothetical protein NC489_08515 [Ruminococcus flavefaciens]|nr:hypothetical protein [Ruminococcus flavefaciens]
MKLRGFLQDTLSVPGSVKIPTRPIIEGYRERYESLKKREKFIHMVYQVVPGNRHMIHVKVPSETVSDFHYDVILELAGESAATFSDCDVTFFSNCPSFVYNCAYVMAHWYPDAKPGKPKMMADRMKGKPRPGNMLIPELPQKLGPMPTADKPVVRNPLGIPMLDKSLYFAIFYIMENLTWSQVQATHTNVTIKQVLVSVADFDHLMVERKRAEHKDKAKKAEGVKQVQRALHSHERELQKPAGIRHAMQPQKPKSVVSVIRSTKQPKSPKSNRR